MNERVPRDRQTPERFNKLQNARLNKRGETLFVSRIEGHDEWLDVSNGDYVLAIDQIAIAGEHDETTYKKGYLLQFEDRVFLEQENNREYVDNITDLIRLEDTFIVRVIPLKEFAESVGLEETFILKTFPVITFTDAVELADAIVIPTRFTLSFTDAVDIVDRDLSCLE